MCDVPIPPAVALVREYRAAYAYLRDTMLPAVAEAVVALRDTASTAEACGLAAPIGTILEDVDAALPTLPPLPPLLADADAAALAAAAAKHNAAADAATVLEKVAACSQATLTAAAAAAVDDVLARVVAGSGPTAGEVLRDLECRHADENADVDAAPANPLATLRAEVRALHAQARLWQRALERLCEMQAALAVHLVTAATPACAVAPMLVKNSAATPLAPPLTRLDVGVLLLFFDQKAFRESLVAALPPDQAEALLATPEYNRYEASGATLSVQGACEITSTAVAAVTDAVPLLAMLLAAGWRGDGITGSSVARRLQQRAAKGYVQRPLVCACAAFRKMAPGEACRAALDNAALMVEGHLTAAEYGALIRVLGGDTQDDEDVGASDVRCLRLAARFLAVSAAAGSGDGAADTALATATRLMPPRLLAWWLAATTAEY